MYVTKTQEVIPKFTCRTCMRFQNKRCTFYDRPMDKNNRCFNHSNYHTVATKYQSPENITEIALNREKQSAEY